MVIYKRYTDKKYNDDKAKNAYNDLVELINEEKFGEMVCLKDGKISSDSLENVIGQKSKLVDPNGELVNVAKKVGISFAD